MNLESVLKNFFLTFTIFAISLAVREIVSTFVLKKTLLSYSDADNSWKRIDLLGTLLMPLSGVFFGGLVLFGWLGLRDIQSLPEKRKNSSVTRAVILGSGILSTSMLSLIFLFILGLITASGGNPAENPLLSIGMLACQFGIVINIGLSLLHLLPLPPFDMYRIVQSFVVLSPSVEYVLERFGGIGVFLLLLVPPVRASVKSFIDWFVFYYSQFAGLVFGENYTVF